LNSFVSRLRILVFFLCLIASWNLSGIAAITPYHPVHTIEEIAQKGFYEDALRVGSARIVLVDYDLIRRDFPAIASLSNPGVDEWILSQTAFVSSAQASQTNANTQIETVPDKTTRAFRPRNYGRALVFPAADPKNSAQAIGLFDAKGVGARTSPYAGSHSDGLATLGECIREFLFEKLVMAVFENSGVGMRTVGTYAVVDIGFDVKHSDGSTSPAGYVLRQAHRRFKGEFSLFSEEMLTKVERLLRKYGITSAGAYRLNYGYDKLNIQGTNDFAVLDFGGFLVLDDFRNRPAQHFFSGQELLSPHSKDWVNPDPELQIPVSIWGTTVSGREDPKADNVWLWSHELARNFREGRANRDDVWRHYQNLLKPAEEVLRRAPCRCARTLRGIVAGPTK